MLLLSFFSLLASYWSLALEGHKHLGQKHTQVWEQQNRKETAKVQCRQKQRRVSKPLFSCFPQPRWAQSTGSCAPFPFYFLSENKNTHGIEGKWVCTSEQGLAKRSHAIPAHEERACVPHLRVQLLRELCFQHHSYITALVPSPLPFVTCCFFKVNFRGETTRDYPTSSPMGQVKPSDFSPQPLEEQAPAWTGVASLPALNEITRSSCLCGSWSALPFILLLPALALLFGRELNLASPASFSLQPPRSRAGLGAVTTHLCPALAHHKLQSQSYSLGPCVLLYLLTNTCD